MSPGDILLAHVSLRSLGAWVCGGAGTVVAALLEAVGPTGTLVIPTQTPECQDPARWRHLQLPDEWLSSVRDELPPFDPRTTPTTSGAVAEALRTAPGAVRSDHPLTSFAAIGPAAARLMAEHEFPSLLGEKSPLAKLEAAGARILLLGTGFDRCTAIHLSEYRLPYRTYREACCVVRRGRVREWVTFRTIELDSSDFQQIGSDLEASVDWVVAGRVAEAPARLLPLAATVRYAYEWMRRHRRVPPSARRPTSKSAGSPVGQADFRLPEGQQDDRLDRRSD